MHPRSPSWLTPGLALALVLVLPIGCKKGGTTDPGGGGGGPNGEKENKGAGVEFAYADQFGLDGQITVDFANDSPEGKGQAKIVAKIRLDATPAASKAKLHGKVVELVEYTGSGSLDAEFMKQQMAKQGTADFDLIAALRASDEWMVVDGHGQIDEEATKALPENVAKGEDKGGGASDFGLFNLPDLPDVPLEVGKANKLPTEEKEEAMFGQTIPMEIDRTWMLVSLGDVGGRKVAKLEVHSESSGAADIQGEGGGGMLAIGQESDFVIAFDVDAKIPISVNGTSMFELSFEGGGQSVSFQNESKIAANYTPG